MELSAVIAKLTTAYLSHKYATAFLALTFECRIRSTLYNDTALLSPITFPGRDKRRLKYRIISLQKDNDFNPVK